MDYCLVRDVVYAVSFPVRHDMPYNQKRNQKRKMDFDFDYHSDGYRRCFMYDGYGNHTYCGYFVFWIILIKARSRNSTFRGIVFK